MLVEVNPGIGLSSSEILDLSQEMGVGLVFDPSHLLTPNRVISTSGQPTRTFQGEWERQFLTFADQLRVVDINAPMPEVENLLRGKGMLKELSQAAKEVGKVEFLRVEIPIPIEWQIPNPVFTREGFNFLRAIGQRLMEG